MRILYVEDNMANLYLVKRIATGHEVINYIDGEEALENLNRDTPDLVFMDIQLAGSMTGLDVVKQMRARGIKTPVVAVTAYAMVGDRERCLEAGCDEYLAKPLPIPEVVALIQKYSAQVKDKQAPAAATPPSVTATGHAPAAPDDSDTLDEPPTDTEVIPIPIFDAPAKPKPASAPATPPASETPAPPTASEAEDDDTSARAESTDSDDNDDNSDEGDDEDTAEMRHIPTQDGTAAHNGSTSTDKARA